MGEPGLILLNQCLTLCFVTCSTTQGRKCLKKRHSKSKVMQQSHRQNKYCKDQALIFLFSVFQKVNYSSVTTYSH